MDSRKLSVGLVSLALLALTGAWAFAQQGQAPQHSGQSQPKADSEENDDEQVITLDKAPEPVRAAAIKLAGGAKNIVKVIREEDDEDAVTFEVEYNQGEVPDVIECAAIFSTEGVLMESEKGTTVAKLPAVVMAALKRDYPKAAYANPFAVTRMFYEVEVVVDGKTHEVKVDAAGNIEDDAAGGDEEHEDANGKEHEEQQNTKD